LIGTLGTSAMCPAGSVSVDTEAECRSAATALGYAFGCEDGVDTYHQGSSVTCNYSFDPKGCFRRHEGWKQGAGMKYTKIEVVYFNRHETGRYWKTNLKDTPICSSILSPG